MSFNSKAEKSPRPHPPRFPQRLSQDKTQILERRRQNFLDKVHQHGDDKKWGNRGEQMLREDFLNHQRQWIESHERSASAILEHPDEYYVEEIDEDVQRQDDDMIDQVLSQEHEELQALVTLLEDRSNEERPDLDESARYGSDEESYDSIFLEILNGNSTNTVTSRSNAQHIGNDIKARVDNEAMDTTG
ncbi:MAG: hypothetical protein Q9188_004836 [Gyalolechia gomerana]